MDRLKIMVMSFALLGASCGDNSRALPDAGVDVLARCPAPAPPELRWWFGFDGVADRAVLSLEDYELLRRYRDAVALWTRCVGGPW